MQPDFLTIKRNRKNLQHSAKGSTWEEHKYIKRIDGTYYYPDSYQGGRHLPDNDKSKSSSEEDRKVFDEFESFSKDLMKKGEAYWDDEEVSKMSKEELADFYEEMTGVKLGKEDIDRLFNSREARNKSGSNSQRLSEKDVENLAREVIRGNFGNGYDRKELLGENYQEVQNRVNQILKSGTSTQKMFSVSSDIVDKNKKIVENIVSAITNKKTKTNSDKKGIDLEEVYKVYKKK